MYSNSVNWVENFTALEYQFKRWKTHNYTKDKLSSFYIDKDFEDMEVKDLIAAITIINQNKNSSRLTYFMELLL